MQRRFSEAARTEDSKVIPLSVEGVADLEKQLQAFKDKFGREPGPGDPVFFDPDCDTPTAIDPERFDASMIDAMRKAKIPEKLIYAYKKTGMIVSQMNKHLFSDKDLREWNAACDEYLRVRHLETAAKFRRPGPYREK
jgi:hypothetical protein